MTQPPRQQKFPLRTVFSSEEEQSFVFRELYDSYYEARRHKSSTHEVDRFNYNLIGEISALADDILAGNYQPSPGIAFVIDRPVIREIFAAPFRDRVVHHFLVRNSADFWDRHFIHRSSSCRIGRGNLWGVSTLYADLRRATNNFSTPVRVARFDISGFFMSIDRSLLYQFTRDMLLRQYTKNSTFFRLLSPLWRAIILDDPTVGVTRRSPASAWDLVPRDKSLFHQPPGYGLVIGNVTSQVLSNLYLNGFDHYVVQQLGHKFYGRYVDDFYIIYQPDELGRIKSDRLAIENYLSSLSLRLHPHKCVIENSATEVNFLGAKIKPFRILPGARLIRSARAAFNDYQSGTVSDAVINSYTGLLEHYDSHYLLQEFYAAAGLPFQPSETPSLSKTLGTTKPKA